jgi:hypothetical protein
MTRARNTCDDLDFLEFANTRYLYEWRLGLKNQCEIEWFNGPHTIHGQGTFAFLRTHLNWPASGRAAATADTPVTPIN